MWGPIITLIGQLMGAVAQPLINWWAKRVAEKQAAAVAQGEAIKEHQADGAQSVANRNSASDQNAALDELARELDIPKPKSEIN